jgi:hypothetical protein
MSFTAKSVALLIALALFLPAGARALTLEKFERMDNDDESTFVAILIEAGVQKYKSAGQPDQAAKMMAFFKTPGRQGGVQKFAAELVSLNGINAKNKDNPNNRATIYQVEDAMALTMKDAGFDIPVSFLLASGKDVHALGPPRGSQSMTP